jgi:hypothetical protein
MLAISQEARFAFENNFKDGNPSVDLISPWMTLRFVAASYAVPQKYIFDATHIEPGPHHSDISLERLNNQVGLGQINNEPALLGLVRDAILAYRANPVATGLLERHPADWMSIQYIANSLGVSGESLLTALHLPVDDNLYIPLGFLSQKTQYPGGFQALQTDLEVVIASLPNLPTPPRPQP